jgi:hypothetical protein
MPAARTKATRNKIADPITQDVSRLKKTVKSALGDFASWKVPVLRQRCIELGLDSSGRKAELVARLQLAHQEKNDKKRQKRRLSVQADAITPPQAKKARKSKSKSQPVVTNPGNEAPVAPTVDVPVKPVAKDQSDPQPVSQPQPMVDEQTRYRQHRELAMQLSNAQLQSMLQKNSQRKSGVKAELVDRVADGMTYGRMPKCPLCNGNLRVKYPAWAGHGGNGAWRCPGKYDDDEYVVCRFRSWEKFNREPWII